MTETYTIDTKIVNDYIVWPILCINCGSDKIIYSQEKQDARCQCCGEWQLTEEMNDDTE